MSCRYAYKDIVPYDCLFKDMTVEGRTLSVERWINEKLFGIYVNEDPDTGVIKGMMGIGMNEDDDKDNPFYMTDDEVKEVNKMVEENKKKDQYIWNEESSDK